MIQILMVFFLTFHSKIVELEEELRVVGNNLKSLEVSEEKVRKCFPIFVHYFQFKYFQLLETVLAVLIYDSIYFKSFIS